MHVRFGWALFVFFAFPHVSFAQNAPAQGAGYECLVSSDAGCLYKIIAERVVREAPRGEVAFKAAETLIARGEYALAEAFIYRRLAEIDETHTYPGGPFNEGMLLLAKIKKLRGENEEAARFLNVAIPASGKGFSPEDIGDDNPAQRLLLLQNAVAKAEKDVFSPRGYQRHNDQRALSGLELARSLASLANEYSWQGDFAQASKVISKINTAYIFENLGNRDAARRAASADYMTIFEDDAFVRIDAFIKGDERGIWGPGLLNILYEVAAHEVEAGNKLFGAKAQALAQKITTGTYLTDAPYRDVRRYIGGTPERASRMMAVFHALAGDEDALGAYLANVSDYGNAQDLPRVMRGVLAQGKIDLALRIAALPGVNKVKAYQPILDALYKKGDLAELRRVMDLSVREVQKLPKDHIAEMMKENARLAYLIGDKDFAKKTALEALRIDPIQTGGVDLACASDGGGFCRVYTPAPEIIVLLMRYGDSETALSFRTGDPARFALYLAESGLYDAAIKEFAQAASPSQKRLETTGWQIAYHIVRSDERLRYRDDVKELLKPFEQLPYTRKAMWPQNRVQMTVGYELMRARMENRTPDMNAVILPLLLSNSGIRSLPEIDKYFDDMGFADLKPHIWSLVLGRLGDYPADDYGGLILPLLRSFLDAGRRDDAGLLVDAYIDKRWMVMDYGDKTQVSGQREAALLTLYAEMLGKGLFDEASMLETQVENPSIVTDMRFQRAKAFLKQGSQAQAAAALGNLPAQDADMSGLMWRLVPRNRPHNENYDLALRTATYLMDRVYVHEALGRDPAVYEATVEDIHRWLVHPDWKFKLSEALALHAHAAGQTPRSRVWTQRALADLRDGRDYFSPYRYQQIIRLQKLVRDTEGLAETTRYIRDSYMRSRKTEAADFVTIVDALLPERVTISAAPREDILFLLANHENVQKFVVGKKLPVCSVPELDKDAFQVHMVTTARGLDTLNLNLGFWQKVFLSSRVRVEAGKAPIILVLNARVPHTWKLDVAAGAQLAAVIIGGVDADISGVPSGVPVLNASTDGNSKIPKCRQTLFMGQNPAEGPDGRMFETLAKVREMTGRAVDHLYWKPETDGAFVVRPLTPAQIDKKAEYKKVFNSAYVIATEQAQSNYLLRGQMVAEKIASGTMKSMRDGVADKMQTGYAGLDKLVKEGYLRPADESDQALFDSWVNGATARLKVLNEDFNFAGASQTGKVPKKIDYIVLKPLVLPPPGELRREISFLVPEDVAPAIGNDGFFNYKVYYMNGFYCKNDLTLGCKF